MTIEEMIEELEENYEAAGYADYYNRVLKGKTDEEIRKIYTEYVKSFEEAEKEYLRERDEYLSSTKNE